MITSTPPSTTRSAATRAIAQATRAPVPARRPGAPAGAAAEPGPHPAGA
jgi:hypothetical protein